MNDYAQPSFYRFNEDSLRLVRRVCSSVKQASHILDLGAGSGIIGIEVANALNSEKLTLLELQKDFIPYLTTNIRTQLNSLTEARIIESSFGNWNPSEKYDLIVSNPPYFLKGHGQISSDMRKFQSRTFAVDDWSVLTKLVQTALSPTGMAIMVVRFDEKLIRILRPTPFKIHKENELMFLELSGLDKD